MTNREWMENLSDEDLARFLTSGLPKVPDGFNYEVYISIANIARGYTSSELGIMNWLNETHIN